MWNIEHNTPTYYTSMTPYIFNRKSIIKITNATPHSYTRKALQAVTQTPIVLSFIVDGAI